MAEDTGTDTQGKETEGPKDVDETPKPTVFDEYRTRINAGEKVFTPKPDEGGSDAKEEPPEGEKAEEEDGAGEGDGEKAEEEADGEGEGDGAGEGAKDEGDEEPPPGDEAGEKGDGDEETFTVGLPARNAGDKDIEFEVDNVASRDDLNRLRKGYMRGEEARQQQAAVQSERDEIEEIDLHIDIDPAGFLLDRVGKDVRIQVARALLLDEDVNKALQEELAGFDDDKDLEHARLKSDAERRKISDEAKHKIAVSRTTKANVNAIVENIRGFIPEGMEREDWIPFYNLALSTAEQACKASGRYQMTKDELKTALTAGRVFQMLPGKGKSPPVKKTAGTDGSGDAPTKVAALKKARLRRKNVAGSSPAGVGSPPASIALPKNQSVSERIAHARKVGIGNILRGKGKG